MAEQETEITLGNGRLFGLFVGLVVLCGVFLVIGYLLGKNTAPGNTMLADTPAGTSGSASGKPAAMQGAPKSDSTVADTSAPQASGESATSPTPEAPAPADQSTPSASAPEMSQAPVNAGYIVQVAAVSKQQDADALAAALRKKQYAVLVVSQPADNLFHVQIGPFADPKDAEAVRSRLVADGYNPILKK
jgi:DedD protein